VVILLNGFSVNLDESFYLYPLVATLPRHDLVDVLISKTANFASGDPPERHRRDQQPFFAAITVAGPKPLA